MRAPADLGVSWRQMAGHDTGPVALGDARDRQLRLLFRRRHLGVLVLVAATPLVGLPLRVSVAVLIMGGVANLLGARMLRRSGTVPGWIHLADILSCLIVTAAVPGAAWGAVAVMVAISAVSASTSGLRTTLAVVALGVAGLWLLGRFGELDDPNVVATAFAVGGGMVTAAVAPLATAERQNRHRLDATLGGIDAVLWVRDLRTDRFAFVNERAQSLLGWSTGAWEESTFWSERVHPEDVEKAHQALDTAIRSGVDQEVVYRFRTTDDRWVHLQDHLSVVVDAAGTTTALQGMSVDVTDRVRTATQMRRYVDIVERMDLALLVFGVGDDADGLRLLAANGAAAGLLGGSAPVQVGTRVEVVFERIDGSHLARRLTAVLRHQRALQIEDLFLSDPDGPRRVVTLRAFPLAGRSVGVSLEDMTDAVTASEALRRQALYDGLTGLPNRRLLDEALHRAVRDTPGSGGSIALLIMDLDQFKEVNDALGHQVGDRLLAEIGHRLAETLPDVLVARLGGDEFAVMLLGHHDVDEAVRVGQQIRDALASPITVDDVRLQTNASIGIALFPSQAQDVATLVQRADVAMYQAKRAGTGVSVYASESDRSSVERLTLMAELPDAVASGELELHFQPTVDIRTNVAVRAEALVRWRHPRLGLLGPDRFIELAELSGAIGPLTRWVMKEGIAAMSTWTAAGHDLGLAINLSVRNLYDPDLVAYLEDLLRGADVDPSRMTLELTETELMDDPRLAREVFTAFGDLGVSTSIDDFGTGYSSLTYLLDLPLQEIKIDRSFVSDLTSESDEFTIVRSMVDLGHNLGLEVVAEGVERAQDLTLLRRLGCDLAQGFYISRPLALPTLLDWLAPSRRDPVPVAPNT